MGTIAERIMQIVADQQISKSEFGRRINVTPAYISKFGKEPESVPSDRTIADICREFRVNEKWLRTGEGDRYIQLGQEEEIAGFLAGILADDSDFKRRLIATLAKLDQADWENLEKLLCKIADGIKKEPGQ